MLVYSFFELVLLRGERTSWIDGMPEIIENLKRLFKRFQYPNSGPIDVARDLGFQIESKASFEMLIAKLKARDFRPSALYLSMPRSFAEKNFENALKKETYQECSLFSYYFNRGWLIFALHFDEFERLSKVYVSCPANCSCRGFSLFLDE